MEKKISYFTTIRNLIQTRKKVQYKESTIVVVGLTGSGKSTLIGNLVKNSTITHNPDIFSVTKETKKYEISHLGRTYKFLDTPGFCDTSGKDKSIISDMGEYIIESCRNVSQVWLLWSGVRLTPEIENVVRIIKDLLDLRTNKERLLIVRTHLANPDDFKEQEDKIISYFKNTFQLDVTLTYYYTIKKDIKENTEKKT